MSEPIPRRVRADLPFRRIALVLSGGGALGAYEVGVLRVLETADLRPSVLAGVSVGAINAVLWLAHGFRTDALERVWGRLSASSVGIRWMALAMRAVGAFLVVLAAVQVALTLAGSPELSPLRLSARAGASSGVVGAMLDSLAWVLVGALGALLARSSRRAEETLAGWSPVLDPHRLHRWFGWVLVLGSVAHVATWITGLAWPHRFSASLLLVGSLVWLANRPGSAGERLRRVVLRLLPETGGRGLWGSAARRRLIRRIVGLGDRAALIDAGTHLIISACDIESGRMVYFVNWPAPSPEFLEHIARAVGQATPLGSPDEVIEAAVASSAIPGVFEPVRIGDREFVDGGMFSNQPLHAALGDRADAIVVVLVSPSGGPPKPSPDATLLELGGRMLEIANWRNLQSELQALPSGWSRSPVPGATGEVEIPSRVCVIEPESPLPGGVYGFSPANASELRRRGERDAWRALAEGGWLAPAGGGVPPGRSGREARSARGQGPA
jgi:predicted acylesterase/phospholipase RssA